MSLQGEVVLAPALVEIHGWVGAPADGTVSVINPGRVLLTVRLGADQGLEVPAEVVVPPGAQVEVRVRASASRPGTIGGTLTAAWESGQATAQVRADFETPPACPQRACAAVAFDPALGRCVEQLTDGVACRTRCVREGVCAQGACVGLSEACDDGDACTQDSCSDAQGCQHAPVQCASDDPCRAPLCDRVSGCRTTQVEDGTACGANDCASARICIAGACVVRPSPEGSACGEAITCRAQGTCRAKHCVLPTPSAPPTVWAYTAPTAPDELSPPDVIFQGHVDEQGNVYFFERRTIDVCGRCATCDCSSVAPNRPLELVSLDAQGRLRFRVMVRPHCPGCAGGLRMVLSDSTRQLAYLSQGTLVARSLDTGALSWTASPQQGLPVHDRTEDGGAMFSLSQLVVVSGQSPRPKLGVPAAPTISFGVEVTEGYVSHSSSIVLFDTTGVRRDWFEVPGHLYGFGTRASGELVAANGACWGPIDRVHTLEANGRRLTRGLALSPLAHGHFESVGTSQGRGLSTIDDPLSGDGGVSSVGLALQPSAVVLTAEQLVVLGLATTTESPPGAELVGLHRATGRVWRTPMPPTVSLEALRDGGTAWQSADELGVVDADGREVLRCALPGAASSPVAIRRGLAYVEVPGGLVALDVGAYDEAEGGWSTPEGGLDRARRARRSR